MWVQIIDDERDNLIFKLFVSEIFRWTEINFSKKIRFSQK